MNAAELLTILLAVATLGVAVYVAWMLREEREEKLSRGELRSPSVRRAERVPAGPTGGPEARIEESDTGLRFMPSTQAEIALA